MNECMDILHKGRIFKRIRSFMQEMRLTIR